MKNLGSNVVAAQSNETTRLLDVTRLVSRIGKTLTGIDRVELAYLHEFVARPDPCFLLCRTAYGFVLLGRGTGSELLRVAQTGISEPADFLSRLRRGLTPEQQRAQSWVRRRALARSNAAHLSEMIAQYLPGRFEYYNVGHTNFDTALVRQLKRVGQVRLNVLIHDTIPLDFPEVQRSESVQRHAKLVRSVSEHADRIITISESSRRYLLPHLERFGRIPEVVVAHLGIPAPTPKYSEIPEHLDLSGNYFVTVGTIEPRKNHELLLEVWDTLPAPKPRLFICGSRGWLNEGVFARLDQKPECVVEVADLSDGALAALVHGSIAMLFPSFAEGFGIPPVEAAIMGVPIVCSDIAVFKEILGSTPVYHEAGDIYSWSETIKDLLVNKAKVAPIDPMPWSAHFELVFDESRSA